MTDDEPFAVIYPLPLNIASRILTDKKIIFTKYQIYEKIPSKLTSCKKILFYISRAKQKIAGEAEIESINLMTSSEVILEHKNNLFLTENEMLKYSNGRENKKMLVFKLGEINRYPKQKTLEHRITMIGEYMSKKKYSAFSYNFNQ